MIWSMKTPRPKTPPGRPTRAAWAVVHATIVAGPAASPGRAADPPARKSDGQKPHVPEALEMLGSILIPGAEIGPGSGWFHPSQSRYDWAWLAPRDKNSD